MYFLRLVGTELKPCHQSRNQFVDFQQADVLSNASARPCSKLVAMLVSIYHTTRMPRHGQLTGIQ